MHMIYCPNCNKNMGFKRTFGFGTLFAVVITGGLWLLVLFFYPERCIACGFDEGDRQEVRARNKKMFGVILGVLGLILLIGAINSAFFNAPNPHTDASAASMQPSRDAQQTKQDQMPATVDPDSPPVGAQTNAAAEESRTNAYAVSALANAFSIRISSPNRSYPLVVNSLNESDFLKLIYPSAADRDGITVQKTWYFDVHPEGDEHALVWINLGDKHTAGQLFLFALNNGRPILVQQFDFDMYADGAGASFDRDAGTIGIKSRSDDGSPECCAQHLDIASYRWNGSSFEEQQHRVEAISHL
jgi:hypothetical protein